MFDAKAKNSLLLHNTNRLEQDKFYGLCMDIGEAKKIELEKLSNILETDYGFKCYHDKD